MSVKSEPYFWLECDRCGAKSTEDGEYAAYGTSDYAVEDARDCEWLITEDGHHYCDGCTVWDEGADMLVNRPPPDATLALAQRQRNTDLIAWLGDGLLSDDTSTRRDQIEWREDVMKKLGLT